MKCEDDDCYETENLIECVYCKKFFCRMHIKPLLPLEYKFLKRYLEDDKHELIKKVELKMGHFCREYARYIA
ncbi:MAG: hypothetical protein N3E37_00280 [Candidatus Micrarchaeota archaeon]|nr:hypothetical protein [Candidatus Micrarchaeota archaeon]